MKGLIFEGERRIRCEDVPEPEVRDPGDVLVKVELAGICGSDLHPYRGNEEGLDTGTIMGHEGIGEVVEVGAGVRAFSKGNRVLSPFTTNCGSCFFCKRGLTSRCENGSLFGWISGGKGLHGMQAEYVRIPLADTTLLAIPEGVSPEQALLLGDVVPTGFFCAEMAEIGPGSVCAVIGCGPVGLMAIAAAAHLGADEVFCIDLIQERLQLGRRYGATPVNPSIEDPVEVVKNATDGRGVGSVLEVVGVGAAMTLAVKLVRPGGIIASVGVHTDLLFGFTPAEVYDRNLTFRTGRCPARAYVDRIVPVVRDKGLDLEAMISHRMPLTEGPAGYEIFDRKLDGCTKVVLTG